VGRDDLKSKAEPGGFIEYGPEQLPKVDSMRRDKSQPDFFGVPILTGSDVAFTTADELGDRPASCYTCQNQNSDLCCNLLGPGVKVEKVTGSRDSGDPIEYWPCCGEHEYCADVTNGKRSKPDYKDNPDTPQALGLIWINAPKPGLPFGGANCGGVNDGDDCDHYLVHGKHEKWDVTSAYCRILGHEVPGGAVCRAWRDDDQLSFVDAQQLLRGDSLETVDKKRLVRDIVGRSDVDRGSGNVLALKTKQKEKEKVKE
jgi:hypothetical protein